MRVTCATLEEFVEDLGSNVSGVLQSTVRVSVTRRPMHEQRPCVKWDVIFQVSAVVEVLVPGREGAVSKGEYLLEMGRSCGIDWDDSAGNKDGSEEAGRLRSRLEEFCTQNGLKLGPGVIEP